MKRSPAHIIAFAILSLPFIACSKNGGNNPPAKTKTELISQSTWKFSSATAGGQDASAFIDDCYKDNTLTFNAVGTGTVDESVNVCNPSSAGTFTWSFENGETDLNLSASVIPTGNNIFDIVTLSETQLVIAQEMTVPPYPPTVVHFNFIH